MSKIFIFSFISNKSAINIGPCWTKFSYRNKSLYTNLIKKISSDYIEFDKYIFCSEDNIASIKGILKAGFQEFSRGYKSKLGIYRIQNKKVKHDTFF